jgi:hypothetical protein
MATDTTAPTQDSRRRRSNRVVFDADVTLALPIEHVWAELIDWGGHGRWIPMTRVDVDPADPNRFIAWSGVGRLALEDRMHATDIAFDGTRGTCHVDKLGPVLVGFAELTVTRAAAGAEAATRVQWHEDVMVPYVPKFLTPVVAKASGLMFSFALKRLRRTAAA